MQRFLFFLFFLLHFQFSFSQTEKLLKGKITANDFAIKDVKIINLNSEKSSISNNNGVFSILASPDDLLVFYAADYQYKRKQINEKDFSNTDFIVRLEKKPIELNEVIIEKSTITAESLGIVSGKQKSYTPAERKLQEAGKFKPEMLLSGLLGLNLPLNPIINAITGRTKKLKNELSIEKCEMRFAKLQTLYEVEFYIRQLKINNQYIPAFQYFVIYDEAFIESLASKNKTKITFRITELASEFNQLLKENETN